MRLAIPAVVVALTVALTPQVASAAAPVVHSGDILVGNHSFEAALSDWSPSGCADSVGTSTERASAGEASLRFTTTPRCRTAAAASARMGVAAGERYTAFAQVFQESGRAQLRLAFRSAAGGVLRVTPAARISASGAWKPVTVSGAVPARATTVEVRVIADPTMPGTSYVDDVRISAQWTDLGEQLHNAQINGSTFGVDGQGRPTAYGVITGSAGWNAHLVGMNADTGEVVSDVALPGATGAWNATTATDGRIYVGTYANGHLYQYTPGDDAAVDLGLAIAGDQFVWDVVPGPDGSVFGGGYPSGGIFQWKPDGGFSQVGPRPAWEDEDYVRSVAYDASNGLVYGGIGSHSALVACDLAAGTAPCAQILPESLQTDPFTYDLAAGAGYVFVRMDSGHSVVLHVTKTDGSVQAVIDADLGTVDYPGASPLVGGKFYYTKGTKLFAYDVAAKTATGLDVTTNIGARRWSAVGDTTIVGTSSKGTTVRYDIATGALTTTTAVDLPGAPTDLQRIVRGPDGRIYAGGFLIGGLSAYRPMRGPGVQYPLTGQTEGMTVLGDSMYLGLYPHARIQVYQPSEPFEAGVNPREVCTLDGDGQDRPYGMLGAPDGRVYIGTMAGYGLLAGALTVYDPATEECLVHKDLVHNQTIHTLAWSEGKVYGGSMIWGGLGQDPTETQARFFSFDPSTGTAKRYDLPVASRGVWAVTAAPDGRLWMVVEKKLLIFDPADESWSTYPLFDYLDYPADARYGAYEASMVFAPDGNVYGTVRGKDLFRIDPDTMTLTRLWTNGANHAVPDDYGSVYFVSGNTKLMRYVP